ncbi:MAG: InlB B-repeat-containing protein [Clostridia bacterium]
MKRKSYLALLLVIVMLSTLVLSACNDKAYIKFDTNGGSSIDDIEITKDFQMPANPTKADKKFAGWFTDTGLTQPFLDKNVNNITKTTTIHAKWLSKYTIEFETNGGSIVDSLTTFESETIIQPADPTKVGYIFQGWFSDITLEKPYVFTTMPNADTTLYAKWAVEIYDANFDTDGGTVIEKTTVGYDSLLIRPADPTKDGYTFDGWYKDNKFTTLWNFATDKATGDVTLYAKWSVFVNAEVTNIQYCEGSLFWDKSASATSYQIIVDGGEPRTVAINIFPLPNFALGEKHTIEIIAKGNGKDSKPVTFTFTVQESTYAPISSGELIGQKVVETSTFILFKGMQYTFGTGAKIEILAQTAQDSIDLIEDNEKLVASKVGYAIIRLTKGEKVAIWKVRIVDYSTTFTQGANYSNYQDTVDNLVKESTKLGFLDTIAVPYTIGSANLFVPDFNVAVGLFNAFPVTYTIKVDGVSKSMSEYATLTNNSIQFNALAVGKNIELTIKPTYQTNMTPLIMTFVVNDGHNVYTQEGMKTCFLDLEIHTVNLLRSLLLTTPHTSENFLDKESECNCIGRTYFDNKENFYIVEEKNGNYYTKVYNQATKDGVVTYDDAVVTRSIDGTTITFTRTDDGVEETVTANLLIDIKTNKPLGHARPNDGNSMGSQKEQNCNPFVRFSDNKDNTITVNGNYFTVDGKGLARLGVCEKGIGGNASHGIFTEFVGDVKTNKLANSYQAIFQNAVVMADGTYPAKLTGITRSPAPGDWNKMVFNNLKIIGNNKRPDGTDAWGKPVNEHYYETSGFICIKGYGDIDVNNCILTEGSSGVCYHGGGEPVLNSSGIVKNTRIYNTNAFAISTWGCYDTTVENCHLSRAGGPLINLQDYFGTQYDKVVDGKVFSCDPRYTFKGDNTFDNWVSGTELWFVASGFSAAAQTLKGPLNDNVKLFTANSMQAIKTSANAEMVNFIICGVGEAGNAASGINPCWDIKFISADGKVTYNITRPYYYQVDSDNTTPDYNYNDPRKQGGMFMAPVNEYSQVTAFASAVATATNEVRTALGKAQQGLTLTPKEQFIVGVYQQQQNNAEKTVAYITMYNTMMTQSFLGSATSDLLEFRGSAGPMQLMGVIEYIPAQKP